MANYRVGFNRILYRTFGATPSRVSVIFIKPNLMVTEEADFTRLNTKVFYKDVSFTKPGDYLGIFYEDGVERSAANFKVEGLFLASTYIECQNCDYFRNEECHRQPPSLELSNPSTTGYITIWPKPKPTDGCAAGTLKQE